MSRIMRSVSGTSARRIPRTLLVILGMLIARQAAAARETPCLWTGVDRIVAVGDLHGDYDRFVLILKGTGLIGDDLAWRGGRTHLVQLGDIMDRGSDARKIFDLLMKLEAEAEAAEGYVHVLLGNHEEANLIGTALDTAGYMNWRQFRSFLPDRYRERMEKKLAKQLQDGPGQDGDPEEARARFWTDLMRSDSRSRAMFKEHFHSRYGKWLLKKNIVIKINDVVFAHGGINEEFSTWKLEDINRRARLEFNALRRGRAVPRKIAYVEGAPLWFRGLVRLDEDEFNENIIERILANLNATHMVVGHTVRQNVPLGELSRFDGRIWGIDTGISSFYKGNLSALIIEEGRFWIWGEK